MSDELAGMLKTFLKIGQLGDDTPLEEVTKSLQDLQKSIAANNPVFEQLLEDLVNIGPKEQPPEAEEEPPEPEYFVDQKVSLAPFADPADRHIVVSCATFMDVVDYMRAYYKSGEILSMDDPKTLRMGYFLPETKVLIRVNVSVYKSWPEKDRQMFGQSPEMREIFCKAAMESLTHLRESIPYDGRAEKHMKLLLAGKGIPVEPPSKTLLDYEASGAQPAPAPQPEPEDRWDELM